ncbi:hypothetical protein BH11PSE2_BH11PSE2_17720 [soil metagenome]
MGERRRKAVSFVTATAVSAAVVLSSVSAATAQVDPFAAVPVRPAPARPGAAPSVQPAAPAQPNRVGFTSVETVVGSSYANAQTKGYANTATIRMLPKTAAPIPIDLKISNGRNIKGRPRIAIPTYVLGVVRQGSIRASAMGKGSDIQQRATTISSILIGVDDALASKLADEADADLIKRLTEAGFDVVPQAEVQASRELSRLALAGDHVQGQNDWTIYGAKSAPLRSGHPFSKAVLAGSGASIVLNDVSVELNAVMLTPYVIVDYARYGGSGNSKYTGTAGASMEVRFRVPNSGANFLYGAAKGKGGGIWGSAISENSSGTEELFGVLFEINDRSDDVGVHNAFASLGLGSLYRQSKYYGVEAVPDRYATLVRAAYQGFNAALVDELKKAKG